MPLPTLLTGVSITLLLALFSLFVGGILLVGGALLLAMRHSRRALNSTTPVRPTHSSAPRGEVLEGEFVILRQRG